MSLMKQVSMKFLAIMMPLLLFSISKNEDLLFVQLENNSNWISNLK